MRAFDRKFGPQFLSELPEAPGVYRVFNAADTLVYVGKARNLRRRLSQYRNARRLKKHRKMKKIVRDAARIAWEVFPSELDACLEEIRIIQTERPKWNTAGRFSYRYPLIGMRVAEASVFFCLTTLPGQFDGYEFFGAFRSREVTGEAFFSLMRLLPFVGHRVPQKKLGSEAGKDYSYVMAFRRLPLDAPKGWADFFRGLSPDALAALSLRLVENAGARARAKEVQDDLRSLRLLWREEIVPLTEAIAATGFASYPVSQTDRDPLFLRFRLQSP